MRPAKSVSRTSWSAVISTIVPSKTLPFFRCTVSAHEGVAAVASNRAMGQIFVNIRISNQVFMVDECPHHKSFFNQCPIMRRIFIYGVPAFPLGIRRRRGLRGGSIFLRSWSGCRVPCLGLSGMAGRPRLCTGCPPDRSSCWS